MISGVLVVYLLDVSLLVCVVDCWCVCLLWVCGVGLSVVVLIVLASSFYSIGVAIRLVLVFVCGFGINFTLDCLFFGLCVWQFCYDWLILFLFGFVVFVFVVLGCYSC